MNYSLQGFSFFPFGVSHWGKTGDKFWSPEHLKNHANRARLYNVEDTNLLLGLIVSVALNARDACMGGSLALTATGRGSKLD